MLKPSSLFHEPWWISATTNGDCQEVIVKQDGDIVGRLPYVMKRRGPFRVIGMPPFTHVLGPLVDAGSGKPQTRLLRRLLITRSLVDQLPPHSYFHQHLDPLLDDGLANADGLAFQQRGFSVAPQYTFEIDCRRPLDDLWDAMHPKTRQPIRRAEERYSVCSVDDGKSFVDFYVKNIEAQGRMNKIDFTEFPALFSECRARECGVILGAFDHGGIPVAMTYLVWGHGTVYYLLSTRSVQSDAYGATSLLLWSAMTHAHQLGAKFDLDGVYSTGTARFLSRFGGRIKARLAIRRSRVAYAALQLSKRLYVKDTGHHFT